MSAKKNSKAQKNNEVVCQYTRARHRYEVEDHFEAGIVLLGSEVKSCRAKRVDLDGAYASMQGDELFLHKMHIAPYEQSGPYLGHEPKRSRKLLFHRTQIEKLRGKITQQGYTLIPLKVYFKEGHIKIELGVCKGKKLNDDRETIRRQLDLAEARAAIASRRR